MPFTNVTSNTAAQTAFANAAAGAGLGEPPGGLNKDDHALWVISELLQATAGSVLRFGAVMDGATDDSGALQRAINVASTLALGIVVVPAGTLLVGTSITLPSNVTIAGAGKGLTTIREHSSLGANPIFKAIGLVGARISNVALRDLTVRNGTATTGTYTASKDGIQVQYCDGFALTNVQITEVQGAFGVWAQYSTKLSAVSSDWYRCTYSCFTVDVECENIFVQHCIFDTLVSTTAVNTYTFATGGSALGVGSYFCKNVWVLDNKFLNNPRWEGIDFHGVENAWVERNYIENCKCGVLFALASGFVSDPAMKNVWCRDNVFIKAGGVADQACVVVQGTPDGTVRAENVHVTGNRITGFGGTATNTIGVVLIASARGVTVRDNHFNDWNCFAVCLSSGNSDILIEENEFGDCANPGFYTNAACIGIRSTGNYGVTIEKNRNTAHTSSALPNYFLYANSTSTSVQLTNNRTGRTNTGVYSGVSSLPVEKATAPSTSLTQKYGDVIFNTKGQPGWIVSAIGSGTTGYGSFVATTILSVDITSGSAVATVGASGTGDYRWVPRGMAVSIAGAGVAGGVLTAVVLDNNVTTITLDTAASTTVSAAALTYQGLTINAVASLPDKVGADNGDASKTLTVNTNETVQPWATTLTANRTVSLSTTGAQNGDQFRIVRTGLGAFTLAVSSLKTIPASTAAAVTVMHNGTAWTLIGYEPL